MVAKRQQLAPTTKTSGVGNTGQTVTIHETANKGQGANAAVHANLQSRGNVRDASWHWTVDDHEAVQSFPHTIKCWHAGKANGNNTSIAIEICVNKDGDFIKATDNAAELAADILREKGHGIGQLVQHNHWSGKNCPTQLRSGSEGVTWDQFVAKVKAHLEGAPVPPTIPPAPPVQHPTNADGSLTLVEDGIRGPATKGRWQEVMGTPVDFVISEPVSTLINADQGFLNSVVPAEHIRNLTGKDKLDVDGQEGKKTVKVRQFWLYNIQAPAVLGRQAQASDFDGILGPETNKLHQHALNLATSGSGRY